MDCEQVREALSARIDGENPGVALERLDSHLADCPGCAAWAERARQVAREVRLAPVAVPDLTASVLAAVAADPAASDTARRRSRRAILRIAVAVAAVAQFVLALPILIGAEAHLSREIAVFEVALAVGFAFVAWRPEWARALVPVAVVAAGGLALTSVVDMAGAQTSLLHETAHAAAVVQAALVWALARTGPALARRRVGDALAAPA